MERPRQRDNSGSAGDFGPPTSSQEAFDTGIPTFGGAIGAKLRSLVHTPLPDTNLLGDIEEVSQLFGEAAAASIVAAEGDAAVEVATAAGSAIAAFFGWWVLVVVLIVVAALLLIEAILYNIGGFIPIVGTRQVQPWVHNHFAWLNGIESAIISEIQRLVSIGTHAQMEYIRAFLQFEGILPDTGTTKTVRIKDTVAAHEIYQLQQQVRYLMHHVGTIQYVTTNKRVTVGVPQNVWDDIHVLQTDIAAMRRDITSLQNQVDKALDTAQSTANRIGDVTATIHEVRAISVGWSDIQKTVSDLQTRVTLIQNSTSERLDNVGRVQTRMQPLTMLQGAGIRGLKTLRQLEDTPCMCPKVHIPKPDGALALAMYEFVTNG